MKKVVRLTESDLVRLVKRVISEQSEQFPKKSFYNLQNIIAQSNEDKKNVPFCKKATSEQLCVVSNESSSKGQVFSERQGWNKFLYKNGYSPVEGSGYSYMNSNSPYSTGQIFNKDYNLTSKKSFYNLQNIIAQSNEDKKNVPFCKKATSEQLCVVSNESSSKGQVFSERQGWNKFLYKNGYFPVEGSGYSYMNSNPPYSTGQIFDKDYNLTSNKRFDNLQTIIAQSNEDKKNVPFCKKATSEQICVVSNDYMKSGSEIRERQIWNKFLNNNGYSPVEGSGYSYMNSNPPYSTGQIWKKD